jgi:hypothetical protein
MQVCQSCSKAGDCRVPGDFARFERVYRYLEERGGPEFLRQRLRIFLHINHCIAEGELDLIHNLVNDHVAEGLAPGAHVDHWGLTDEGREHMIALRRAMA